MKLEIEIPCVVDYNATDILDKFGITEEEISNFNKTYNRVISENVGVQELIANANPDDRSRLDIVPIVEDFLAQLSPRDVQLIIMSVVISGVKSGVEHYLYSKLRDYFKSFLSKFANDEGLPNPFGSDSDIDS